MSDIFLSYASEDRVHAALLAKALEENSRSVWWDQKVRTGQRFRAAPASRYRYR